MTPRFTLRQLMILVADVAILATIERMIPNKDDPSGSILASLLIPYFPFSFAVLILLFDREGPGRKTLAENVMSLSPVVFLAWWLWFYYVLLGRHPNGKSGQIKLEWVNRIVVLMTTILFLIQLLLFGLRMRKEKQY